MTAARPRRLNLLLGLTAGLIVCAFAIDAEQNIAAVALMKGIMVPDRGRFLRGINLARQSGESRRRSLLVRALSVNGSGSEALLLLVRHKDWPPATPDLRSLLGKALARQCRTREVDQLLKLRDGCRGSLLPGIAQALDQNCPASGKAAFSAITETCGATFAGLAALRLKADWYYRHQEIANAIATQRLLLKEQPESGEAWSELARLLYEKGDYLGAISVANHALTLPGKDNIGAIGFRGAAYLELGRTPEAIRDLRRSITEEVRPSPYTRLQLARAYRLAGDERAAQEEIRQVKVISPELVRTLK